jgi:hypothetical protein
MKRLENDGKKVIEVEDIGCEYGDPSTGDWNEIACEKGTPVWPSDDEFFEHGTLTQKGHTCKCHVINVKAPEVRADIVHDKVENERIRHGASKLEEIEA